ncbi:MAG: hypothetical protein ACPGO3_10920 [Magnetospiraceae bacterium]
MRYLPFLLLLIPALFALPAVIVGLESWTAVSGAIKIQGTIDHVEEDEWPIIYVTFKGPLGDSYTQPVQFDGTGPDNVEFASDLYDVSPYTPGTPVNLLFHPELGGLVWIDDFWILWAIPLVVGGIALFSLLFVSVGIYVFVFKFPDPPRNK